MSYKKEDIVINESSSVVRSILDGVMDVKVTPAIAGRRMLASVPEGLAAILDKPVDDEEGVTPVHRIREIVRYVKLDNNGFIAEGERHFEGGEHILIGVKEKVSYIVKDVASAFVVSAEANCSVAVYDNIDNLADVVKTFPAAITVAGASDIAAVREITSNVCDIGDFGGDSEERKIFKKKVFDNVFDFYKAGGDVNIMLKSKKVTRIVPLWWALKRARKQSWIVEGFLPDAPGLVVVFSAPNVGKTFFAIDLSLTVASGRTEWFGRKVKPGSVLYLCGEGNDGFFSRVKCWLQEHNEFNPEMVKFKYDKRLFSFDRKEDYDDFVKCIETRCIEEKPRLIVVDTLNLYMCNDENSTEEMSTMLKSLKTFCNKYECTIIILHHSGLQDASRERGSSTLRGCVDVAVKLSRKGDIIKIEQVKNRNGEIIKPLYARLEKHVVTAFRSEDDDEPFVDCILRQVEAPKESKFTKAELFLIDFCLDRYEKRSDWKNFYRSEIVAYGKRVLSDSSVAVTAQLNPRQKGKYLNSLLRDEVLRENRLEEDEGSSPVGKFDESYEIVSEKIISTVEERIAERTAAYDDTDM